MDKMPVFLYFVGSTLLLIYGIEVCPHLETLHSNTNWVLMATIYGAATVSLLGRYTYLRKRPNLSAHQRLKVDIIAWLGLGLLVAKFNLFVHDIPLESGIRILVGSFAIGTLISTLLSLMYEGQCIRRAAENPNATLQADQYFSMTKKFAYFSTFCLGQFALIMLMLIYHDLAILRDHVGETIGNSHHSDLFTSILVESIFVLGVLLAGSLSIALAYSKNVSLVYGYIHQTLERVEKGDYSKEIPIASSDEFGQISSHTNLMISGLRDRERIKNIFGKYVSPNLAKEILSQHEDQLLEGRSVKAAVLFADLRNFTTISEKHSAKEVVQMLNIYFDHFVASIHKNGGVLDKFIGDAVMAVFTETKEHPNPSLAAVTTALEVRKEMKNINDHLASHNLPQVDNGIGIDYGEVISGNIGSHERMEYTVIGDTVNTAARLESQTKSESASILISKAVFENLNDDLRKEFTVKGLRALKGKEDQIQIFQNAS
ncbi:MAG: hypothetical protein CL676_03420 [Bdellovibrionaceae bacterium]|nr:hypothetical protein [Pseudobdellovibrionaceae bacterium]|tara:strand:+ start:46320 stop:47780 length:1461 start_codon:yes stop_codon:yes gene_type:complete